MKRLILTIAFGMACIPAIAQGTLNFANANTQVNARLYLHPSSSTPYPAGTDYIAQLWYGALGSNEDELRPHPVTSFFSTTPSQAGYFFGGARTIDGFAGGNQIVVQVRAWKASAGNSWENVVGYTPERGKSGLFNVTLAIPPATPSNLVGLQSFMIFVPEPSTISLAGLGAVALMIFRRRK